MRIYCDMDGVLVHQTARDGFDKMGWMPDGKILWSFIRAFSPTLLTQLPDENYERCAPQKRIWAARELGDGVPIIVVPKSKGKALGHAAHDAILIDDSAHIQGKAWEAAGGVFVHHKSAEKTIIQLKLLLLECA